MNLICLDLDGTLEDSRKDMVAITHRIRARLGLPSRLDEAILPWISKGMDALYRACFDDYIREDDARLAEVRSRYEADYLENVAVETRLYPGIVEALKQLSGIGHLAMVTNKPERISWRLVEFLGIDKFFTALIGGDTCARAKPDPMVLEEAARRCGFDPTKGRAVVIGDTMADIQMGRAFGAKTIWCAWGYVDQPGESPDFVAKAPSELPVLVCASLGNR